MVDNSACGKLERLRIACEQKVCRIERFENIFLNNEREMEHAHRRAIPETFIANLKNKAIILQIFTDQKREKLTSSQARQHHLESVIKVHKLSLLDAFDKLQMMANKYSPEKKSILIFSQVVESFVIGLKENFEMAREEGLSLLNGHVGTTPSKSLSQLEWYRRLIAATNIQRQEAERVLSELEREFDRLSKCANK